MKNKQTKPKARGAQATKSEIQALQAKVKKLQLNRTPFRDTGGIIGKHVGNLFGVNGSSIGKWLGSGIGAIFGSGDYTVTGPTPSYNVLTSSNQIPKFASTMQTNVICHREYLGDITGTTAFTNATYPLNPGISKTFPWLSTIAANYQEYRIHGLVFEFRPLITDFVTSGAPGVVVMATNYNSDALPYVSKQVMENSEFATSVKPTCGLMHAVECDINQTILPQRYVRTGGVPTGQDLRLYDHGLFQLATLGNPIQDLGELWVTYCVEFFKPVLPSATGSLQSAHMSRTSNASTPWGTVQVFNVGGLSTTITSSTLSFVATPGAIYLFEVTYIGTSVVCGNPGYTYSAGLSVLNYFNNDTYGSVVCPVAGATSSQLSYSICLQCNLTNVGTVVISAPGGITTPVGYVDLFLTELDPAVVS